MYATHTQPDYASPAPLTEHRPIEPARTANAWEHNTNCQQSWLQTHAVGSSTTKVCNNCNKKIPQRFGSSKIISVNYRNQFVTQYARCGRKVMGLIFYLPKLLFFSNMNVIPFKIVPLDSYAPMEMFPLLVAALEVFNRYGLQHVRYSLLYVF